jgi:hypothetical protein
VAGSCEYGDESSGSGATELVIKGCEDIKIITKTVHNYRIIFAKLTVN